MVGAVISCNIDAIWAWWVTLGRSMLNWKTNNLVICFYGLSVDKREFLTSQAVV